MPEAPAPVPAAADPPSRPLSSPAQGPDADGIADPADPDTPSQTPPEAVARLEGITRRLREECPWDREQDERSIVPHTVEEAYELAEAATLGDDDKLSDELGDVLFQVHFLALLLEERGAGGLTEVADGMREKLIRRHPHVFGEEVADTSGEVLGNWDRIKQEREGRSGLFADVPENLPGLLHARKLQRRAVNRAPEGADTGLVGGEDHGALSSEVASRIDSAAAAAAGGASGGPGSPAAARDALERDIGEALFAIVELSRRLKVDPELALRSASARFKASLGDA